MLLFSEIIFISIAETSRTKHFCRRELIKSVTSNFDFGWESLLFRERIQHFSWGMIEWRIAYIDRV